MFSPKIRRVPDIAPRKRPCEPWNQLSDVTSLPCRYYTLEAPSFVVLTGRFSYRGLWTIALLVGDFWFLLDQLANADEFRLQHHHVQ